MTDEARIESDEKGPGRDQAGRFQPGHRLGGRPPGSGRRPLFDVAQERAAAEGFDLDAALFGVVKTMLAAGLTGDAACANLVFRHLCADPRDLAGDGSVNLRVETGVPTQLDVLIGQTIDSNAGASDEDLRRDLARIVARIRERKAAAAARPMIGGPDRN